MVGIFGGAAALVWIAGTRLSGYAEAISERTGLGAAFVGALLLGGITSLPELATTLSASIAGDADMAVNNIFGGVAMQVAVLAVADATLRTGAISAAARAPIILVQGVLLIGVLVLAMAGMIVGEPTDLPVGAWSTAVFLAAVGAFYVMRRHEGHAAWKPVTEEGRLEEVAKDRKSPEKAEARAGNPEDDPAGRRRSLRALIGLCAVSAVVILAAGFALTRSGEALATRTGLGSSFVGAALVAASTSLPEVSTTIAAARLGRYDMAFSNVFGANLLDVALIGVTDVVYPGPPVLDEMGTFALFGALLAVGVTAVFLAGLILHRVRTFRWVGVDSIAVLALYLGGLYVLFTMR